MVKRYNLNNRISATEVRVIDEKGENLGVLRISDAINRAREVNLDLVEVGSGAKPPVCKILDFKKFLYLEKQKLAKSKSKSRKIKQREFRLRPNIGENDLKIRLDRAKKFLLSKDRVKFTFRLRGRENAHPEVVFDKIKIIEENLKDVGKMDEEPKKQGNQIITIIIPL